MKKIILVLLCGIQISCAQDNLTEANRLKGEAAILMKAKDYQATINAAKQALVVFEKNKDTINSAETLYLMARASALSKDFESAVKYGEKGSQLCLLKENYPLEYKINHTLSWAYFTLGKDFSENLEHQKRQLYVVNQMDDEKAKALVYNNYGYDTTVSGTISLDSTIAYMKFANDYYAKAENNKGRWYTLMNLTWQYRLKNDLQKSEHYGRLSAQQARADNDRHAIIEANTNLGETLLYQNKLQEAAPYYEEGLKWSNQKEDRDTFVFDVYYSKYLWKKGEKKKAISAVKKAIKFLETSEVFYEMLGRAFLADYSYQSNNFTEVKKQLEVFNNPRSNYISLEAKTLAKITEVKLLSKESTIETKEVLKAVSKKLEEVGATQLINQVIEAEKIINKQ